jgi:hypothetical protein
MNGSIYPDSFGDFNRRRIPGLYPSSGGRFHQEPLYIEPYRGNNYYPLIQRNMILREIDESSMRIGTPGDSRLRRDQRINEWMVGMYGR